MLAADPVVRAAGRVEQTGLILSEWRIGHGENVEIEAPVQRGDHRQDAARTLFRPAYGGAGKIRAITALDEAVAQASDFRAIGQGERGGIERWNAWHGGGLSAAEEDRSRPDRLCHRHMARHQSACADEPADKLPPPHQGTRARMALQALDPLGSAISTTAPDPSETNVPPPVSLVFKLCSASIVAPSGPR